MHDALSPFGSHDYCDQCDGTDIAVRYPVSVDVGNFSDLDQAAYVVLYSAPTWDGQWVQSSYPSIINAVHAENQTLDLCKVPQQESLAPSLKPTEKPTVFVSKEPTRAPHASARRSLLNEDDHDEEEEGRRLATGNLPPKTASGALEDDYQNDDYSAAELSCCFGSPGQTYIVACLTTDWSFVANSGNGQARIGQHDKGPPFDDRCLAVAGVCGNSCGTSLRSPHVHCESGIIPQRFLVSDYCGDSRGGSGAARNSECSKVASSDVADDDYGAKMATRAEDQAKYFHMPWNDGNDDAQWYMVAGIIENEPVWHWSFMVMMFMAFTSTVLAYTPGIGRCGSSRARLPILHTLNSQGAIKDGAECVSFSISASEHKLWVLRNMVCSQTQKILYFETLCVYLALNVTYSCHLERRLSLSTLFFKIAQPSLYRACKLTSLNRSCPSGGESGVLVLPSPSPPRRRVHG